MIDERAFPATSHRRWPWAVVALISGAAAGAMCISVGYFLGMDKEGRQAAQPVHRLEAWDVSVYFCVKASSNPRCVNAETTEAQRIKIKVALLKVPSVARVVYESKDEAFQRFQELYAKDFQQKQPNMPATKPGEIPDSFRVSVKAPSNAIELAMVVDATHGQPGVDQVVIDGAAERFLARQDTAASKPA